MLAGSGLALLAGMAIARARWRPIAELTTHGAREIERTRDPSSGVPQPRADDEVAELARTLEGMLGELDAARGETEAMLARQRRFVADASHELRTPLTSVLANLELLAESLARRAGRGGRARRCAPPSGCAGSWPTSCCSRAPTPRATHAASRRPRRRSSVEAAAELGAVSDEHEIALDIQPAPSSTAARDDFTAS